MQVDLKRVDNDYHIEAAGTSNVVVNIDGSPSIGGHNKGARPMELILMGLGGCASMDVISILKKQKQEIESYYVTVEAERVDETPAVFKSINVHFKVSGKLDESKLKRAIDLSMDKYCSVSAMLRDKIVISYSYELNN